MPRHFEPEHAVLSNGIPVIFQHFEGTVAATYWWVRTGSADESAPEAGFAHFLEHMLFKDAAAKETGLASTGRMARAIESLGGDINAYTSFDQTVYHVTCAAHHWERVIDAFGTMARPQRFLREDFEREREVILEELRKNEDAPGRQLFQTVFSQTFGRHPYGKPVIGLARTLKAAKVGALESFYRRNYVSGKMGIILVGPLHDRAGARRKAIMKLLEKRFGGHAIPRRDAQVRARPVEPQLRKSSVLVTKGFDVKTPSLSFAFRVPELSHEDVPALDLLAGILGMGELSRLYQRLFYQKAIATDVSGGLFVPRDPGMLYFQLELDSVQKIDPAALELFEELSRVREEGPTVEELARVIVNAESERLYATQTADGMAGRIGYLKFVVGDMDFDRKYLERLRDTDPARIREVARHYLDFRRMTGVALVPEADKTFKTSGIGSLAKRHLNPSDCVSRAVGPTRQRRDKVTDLPVEFLRLPSGIRVAYYERSQSHVFSVHGSVLAGSRLEEVWGEGNMMALTWTKGTASMDSRAISSVIEGNASSMDGFSGRNSVGVQLTGLARDWSKLSGLFTDVLLEPSFPESEVDHSRRLAEDAIRGLEDHTSQLCSKLFLETLFESHPYGKQIYGSIDSIGAIHHPQLMGSHRVWMRPDRLSLAVSGAVKRPILELWLTELDRRALELAGKFKAVDLPGSLNDEPQLKAPRWVERSLGREQAHIIVGGIGTRITAPDRHALRLMQTLLGGQSGRLFVELREKKSLAYSVAPLSFEGIERGYIGTYIACSPKKRDEAIAGIRAVLEKLAEKGPSANEMARAKEFYLGRRAMDLQSDPALASHYGLEQLYEIPRQTEAEIIRTVSAIRARDIQRVCREYLVAPHMVTAVVG